MEYEADAFRFFVLLAHYRSPIDSQKRPLEAGSQESGAVRQAAKTSGAIERPGVPLRLSRWTPAVALAKAKFWNLWKRF